MAMNAALLVAPGESLVLTTVNLDGPLPDEVVVRTECVGLCHSDLHYADGSLSIDMPALLGHEVSGVVELVGSAVTRLAPGDHVVATITPSCGICRYCVAGRPAQCTRVAEVRARPRPRVTLPGGTPVAILGGIGAFAEAFLAREGALALVPPDVPAQVSCLLGCCVTTGVGAIVHGARVTSQDTVAVIGCGGVGISAIQGARLAGARRIIAIDVHPTKLEVARTFGATDAILATADSSLTVAQLMALVPGGVSHAIEAVGRPQTASLAFDLLAPGGTATILGLMPEGQTLEISADALVYGDRRIQGAYMGANRFLNDVDMFVDHYRSQRLDLDRMVTAVIPFAQLNEGMKAMANPNTVRIVLDMGAGQPARPA